MRNGKGAHMAFESRSTERVVSLRSGGVVTIAISHNPFKLSLVDREFLSGLIDRVQAYDQDATLCKCGHPRRQHQKSTACYLEDNCLKFRAVAEPERDAASRADDIREERKYARAVGTGSFDAAEEWAERERGQGKPDSAG